jgi:hypothetical protein
MVVLISVLLLLSWSLGLQAVGEGGEGGSALKIITPCAISHEKLYSIFPGLLEENLTLSVNCLAFDKIGALESGILSGVDDTGGPGMTVSLSCLEGVIAAKPSSLPPSSISMSSTACLSCSDQGLCEMRELV